jgi:DNA-binding transcriptional LysR family regulator
MTRSHAALAAWRALVAAGLTGALAAGCSAATPASAPVAESLVLMASAEAYSSALRLRLGFLAQAGQTVDLEIRLVAAEATQSAVGAGESQLVFVVGDPDPQWWAAPIASVPIRVVVNASNALAEIDEEDLRGIFAGNLTDWQDIGGPAHAVSVITQDSQFETARAFQRDVLGGAQIGGGAIVAPSGWAMAQAVGDDPGAIGYLMCNDSTPRIRPLRIVGKGQPASHEASARLFAIALHEPTGAALEFLLWAQSPSGQQALLANCGE